MGRQRAFGRLFAACLAAAAVGPALAGVDLTVRNGDRIASALDAGGEVETFRFACPAGARVSVKAKSARKGPPLRVRAIAPGLAPLGERTGTAASVAVAAAPVTGVYTAEVAAADGTSGTPYSVTIAWKSPKKFAAPATLEAGGEGEIAFSGEAGATATLSVKKARRSAAVPVVVALSGPDGATALAPGATATVVLPVTGDYTLTFGDSGAAGGAVTAAVKVKPAKPVKLIVNLGASGTPPGTSLAASRLVGPAGGTLAAELDGPLAGTSVTVPADALTQATSLLLGATSVIATTAPGISAGPAIFLGPEGLSFAPAPAQVTIPFDVSLFPAGPSGLRVYTRAADGTITEITGFTVDELTATVTFPVSHFSTFEVRRAFNLVERPKLAKPASTAQIGTAAAVDGGLAAFGIPFQDPTGIHFGAGAVAVYHRETDGTWTSDGILTTPNFQAGENLGSSISLSGDTLLAGSRLRTPVSERTGAGEVWRRDGGGVWQFEAELVPPNGLFGWEAGNAVAIDGDTAVVAAHGDAEDASQGGAVHVFVRSGSAWTFQARLTEAVPGAGGKFGGSVAIDGDTIVVGSYESTARPGFVQVFHRTGTAWSRDGRLEAPAGFNNDTYGTSVSVSGGRIAVGAPLVAADGTGRVFVYRDEGTTLPLESTIAQGDPAQPFDADGLFGSTVALRGGVLAIAARLQDVRMPNQALFQTAGQVFVYESPAAGKWLLTARLRGTAADVSPIGPGNKFGTGMAFDGETIVAGAPDAAFGAGEAFAFDLR